MGCRDLIRSQLWYNSVGGDQIEIWWVVETGSEVNCGIITRVVPKSRQDDRQQYTFEGRIQWKNTEKTLDKKGDKLTDNDRAFGHWPLLCNDLGVCSGRQNKRSTIGHVMYAMIHPCLYLIQSVTEWGKFRRQKVCANPGFLLSNPSTGVRLCRLRLQ